MALLKAGRFCRSLHYGLGIAPLATTPAVQMQREYRIKEQSLHVDVVHEVAGLIFRSRKVSHVARLIVTQQTEYHHASGS
jgi:hypothetical protein